MVVCERCSTPLSEGRRRGLCAECRSLCPRRGKPNGRAASVGYCAQCQRERRETRGARPDRPAPRHGQTFIPDPGLKEGQVWFRNFVEQRLPVQQITLDVEHSADVTWTFYRRHEFHAFLERCLGRLDPEEVRQIVNNRLQGRGE